MPLNDKDLEKTSFALLVQRVQASVLVEFGDARWHWEIPNPRRSLTNGHNLYIRLNRAGGFQRARVLVQNLKFAGLRIEGYPPDETVPDGSEGVAAGKKATDKNTEQTILDVGESAAAPVDTRAEAVIASRRLAADWIRENHEWLISQYGEAKDADVREFSIPSAMLPGQGAWPALCEALVENHYTAAEEADASIRVSVA